MLITLERNMFSKISLLLILLLALTLRVVDLGTYTPGLYLDEASLAYDAYSMGLNGTDQFGKSWPIYFRSFAMYQAPLYIYLSVLPVNLLGMNPISIRILSVISGMLTIVLVYWLIKLVMPKGEKWALFSAFVLAISPWSVLFSRNALEANLGLFLFVLSLCLLFFGIFQKSKVALFLGLVTLSVTNYAYHSYRFTSIIVALSMPIFFWKEMIGNLKKVYIVGLLFFCLILIPQLLIINTAGSLRRAQLLNYSSTEYFNQNGGDFKNVPVVGRYLFVSRAFLAKYFDYLSPKSIFFDTDPAATKSILEMSSFYSWMIVFYILGIIAIVRKYHSKVVMFFILIGLASIVPSAITTDNLYMLRMLSYLFVVSLIVGLGLVEFFNWIKYRMFKILLILFLVTISIFNLYVNYFHVSKYELKGAYSGLMNELFEYSKQHQDKNFVVDIIDPFNYGIALYVYQYDPKKYQEDLNFNVSEYYDNINVPKNFEIANLQIREIDWGKDANIEQYLVGDELSIPEHKAKANNLTFIQKFEAPLDRHHLVIYKTNPK